MLNSSITATLPSLIFPLASMLASMFGAVVVKLLPPQTAAKGVTTNKIKLLNHFQVFSLGISIIGRFWR